MKLDARLRSGYDVRALWAFVVLFAGCGVYVLQTHYQAAIGLAHERTERLYAQVVADSRIVREAGRYREVQRRAEVDLAHVSHAESFSAATADLLATLERSGAVFSTRVLAVQPGAAPAGTDADTSEVTIRVRGRFANVLRFIEDLSHHSTLVQVSDTEIMLAARDRSSEREPRVDATIHAAIYRLRIPFAEGARIAPAG